MASQCGAWDLNTESENVNGPPSQGYEDFSTRLNNLARAETLRNISSNVRISTSRSPDLKTSNDLRFCSSSNSAPPFPTIKRHLGLKKRRSCREFLLIESKSWPS